MTGSEAIPTVDPTSMIAVGVGTTTIGFLLQRGRQGQTSARARLLARLKTNLRQVREQELRMRLLAAIEQLTKGKGGGKS